jgi:hypothetical protein
MATGLALVVGCFSVNSDLTNMISAGAKLASNPADPPIGDITAAEMLSLSRNLPELAAQFPQLGIPADLAASAPELTEEQAEAIVAFLDQYGVDTISELQALILAVQQGTQTVTIPQALLDLAASMGFETDASRLAP